jgi:xylan 1,4-beta-xylosidase
MINHKDSLLPIHHVQFISNQDKIKYCSNNYIFFLALEGKVHLVHDEEPVTLKKGDIYFRSHLPSGKANIFAQSSVLIVYFSPEFIAQHIPSYPFEFIVNSSQSPGQQNNNIISLLLDITYQYLTDKPNQLKLLSLSYNLLDELTKSFTVIPSQTPNIEEKKTIRMRRAANYVNQNYSTHITLSDIAADLYISPQHCSRFFKQFFQMSFLEYLNYIRLQHALEQIQYNNDSITQVAFQNGFPNLSSFNRVFKKHMQTTPNEYRKKIGKEKEKTKDNSQFKPQTSVISLDSLKQYEHELSLASSFNEYTEKFEELQFRNDNTSHSVINFDNILNLGLISDCLMHNYYIQISEMQSSLNFRYARFHGILDDTIISKIPNTGKYNYQYVDMILDHFQEIGLIPFIELGNIPQRLSFSLSDIEPYVDSDDSNSTNTSPYITDFDKLRHFIKHCIYRYGIQTVENWYFEIWMDFEQYSYISDINIVLDTYIEHYLQCRHVIKLLLPNVNVGGPGFNTVAPFSVITEFFKKSAAQKLELDFITAYLYPYKLKQKGAISKEQVAENVIVGDETTILKRLSYFCNAISHSTYNKKPLFIPEYHFSVSPRNHMNDSCFQACFILKNLLESNEAVRGYGYFRALDISANYSDSVAPVFGGPGFITRDNIKKPSYYAYLFLNSIRGELIDKGEGYILTRIRGNKYRLLLYYYIHPDSDFLLQPKNYPPRYYTEKLCPNAVKKKCTINIQNMTNSDYVIKHRFINSENGSVLNEWVMLNSSLYLSRNDISYLRNICVPHQTIEVSSCKNDCLTFSATLMPHEIRFIEITPISET